MDNNFKYPLQKYRGCDLWMLNDELDDKELEFQIEEMKSRGFGCVIARTYNGLKSDYPGEDFMHKMDVIINKAKEVGLEIVLQAAYMPKACVGLTKEETLGIIECKKDTEEILSNEELISSYQGINYVFSLVEGSLNMFGKDAVSRYIKRSYQDAWIKYSNEFGKTIRSIWVDEPRYDEYHIPWFAELPELFEKKYGYSISENVHMLYVDTGDFKKVRYHFWTLLRDLMGQNYFAQIRKWCDENNIGFSGHLMGEERLKSQVEHATANMPYYKYFDVPGIDVLKLYANWDVNELKNFKEERHWFTKYTVPVQCVSAAYQAGREDILAELYGCSTESVSFRDQKYYFDHFAAFGINHRCSHAVFYSLHGFRKRFYPPHINYYQPYWKKYNAVTDYVARVSSFVSKGAPVSDLLLIHPLETAYGIKRGAFSKSDITYVDDLFPTHDMERYDYKMYKTVTDLICSQNYFHFGDLLTILEDGKVEDDRFIIGKMSYSQVVLPNLEVITSDLLDKLEAFTSNGGKVYVLGFAPTRLDGVEYEGLATKILSMNNTVLVKDNSDLISRLENTRGYTIKSDDGIEDILVNYRMDDKCKYFFVLNDNCSHNNTVHITVPGSCKITRFDGKTGEISDYHAKCINNKTTVSVCLLGGESIMLCVEDGACADEKAKRESSFFIDGDWKIKRHDDNVINLEFASYSKDGVNFSDEYTILAINDILSKEEYKGDVYLKYKFVSDFDTDNLTLAVEKPQEQEIWLNGNKCDNNPVGYYFAKEFKKIILGKAFCGENEILIKRPFYSVLPREMNLFDLFMTKPKVELESLYLLGDFAVKSNIEHSRFNGDVRMSKSFVLSKESSENCSGELVSNGYPFYAGKITLSKEIYLSQDDIKNENISLRILRPYFDICEVTVNGENVGDMCWHPYTLDIKKALKEGTNSIELTLYTSLRNLLGPSHNPRGEVGLQSPAQFVGHYDEPDWYNWADVDSNNWTNSYNFMKLGVRGIQVVIK